MPKAQVSLVSFCHCLVFNEIISFTCDHCLVTITITDDNTVSTKDPSKLELHWDSWNYSVLSG